MVSHVLAWSYCCPTPSPWTHWCWYEAFQSWDSCHWFLACQSWDFLCLSWISFNSDLPSSCPELRLHHGLAGSGSGNILQEFFSILIIKSINDILMIKLYDFYILHCHYRLSDHLWMQEALRHIFMPWDILRQWTLGTSQDHSEMNLMKDPRSWKSIL